MKIHTPDRSIDTIDLDSFSPFNDFLDVTNGILTYLHKTFGFSLWMITRTEGNDWIVLDCDDSHYGVKRGDIFRWSDSFCSRMVKGLGPSIAPDSTKIKPYLEAPIGQKIPIQAYVGLPLHGSNGSLFGTLCAIDPSPQPEELVNRKLEIQIFARIVSTLIEKDTNIVTLNRKIERAELEATHDSLTGLYNKRGWDRFLEKESFRCKRYGSPASIIYIDLDNLKEINDQYGHSKGDDSLVNTSNILQGIVRTEDIVARLGGDEFSVLAIESDEKTAKNLVDRIKQGFKKNHVRASIGWAQYDYKGSLQDTVKQADENMYSDKKARKSFADL